MLKPRPLIGILPLLAVLAIAPDSSGTAMQRQATVAQVLENVPTPFDAPRSLRRRTNLTIEGSPSLTLLSQSLKEGFELRYPRARVDLAMAGTPEALERLREGEADLVAIGRPLASEEKDAGLAEVPLRREKIAIIVGKDNPFQDQLGYEQFAKIVSGEITNWEQVGGPDRPIRFIDRPESSDTRQSFRYYDVFSGTVTTGPTADPVAEDSTAAVVEALGDNGIGYALYSQVKDNPDVRVIRMGALPSDPAYPFSQSQGYVYEEGNTNRGARAFLGWAASDEGLAVVESTNTLTWATVEEPTASTVTIAPAPTTTASPTAPGNTGTFVAPIEERTRFPWWILLIPFLLAGLFLLWRDRHKATAESDRPTPPLPPPDRPAAALPEAPNNTPVSFSKETPTPHTPHPTPHTPSTHPPIHRSAERSRRSPSTPESPPKAFPLAGAAALAGAAGMAAANRSKPDTLLPDPWETPTGESAEEPIAPPENHREAIAPKSPADHVEATEEAIAPLENHHEAIAPESPADHVEATEEAIAPPETTNPPDEAALAALAEPAESAHLSEPPAETVTEPSEEEVTLPESGETINPLDAAAPAAAAIAAMALSAEESVSEEPSTVAPEPRETPESLDETDYPEDTTSALAGAAMEATETPTVAEASVATPEPAETSNLLDETDYPENTTSALAGAAMEATETTTVAEASTTPPEPVETATSLDKADHPKETTSALAGSALEATESPMESDAESTEPSDAALPLVETGAIAGAALTAAHSPDSADLIPSDVASAPLDEQDGEQQAPEPAPATEYMTVDNRAHCFVMDPARLQQMQEVAVRYPLDNGHYKIFIESGSFDYQAPSGHPGEPWVLLWIYGGQFINQKTRVPVSATWSTLNGYHDSLTLRRSRRYSSTLIRETTKEN